MELLKVEQSTLTYRADYVAYFAVCLGLVAWLAYNGFADSWAKGLALVAAGLLIWTLVEYLMHRFLFHGPQPFERLHGMHHHHPKALISTPTWASGASFLVGAFLPLWLLTDAFTACALVLGLLIGYLAYSITHHATHHWKSDNAWLRKRKYYHALHHNSEKLGRKGSHYGVITVFWDRVFGTL